MISLLRFKATTEKGEKGEHAYTRYLAKAMPAAEKVGARLVWYGEAREVFVGSPSDSYDRALVVEYPSRAAFAEMFQNADYQASLGYRDEAIDKMVMLVSTAIGGNEK